MNPAIAISFVDVSKRFARPDGSLFDVLDRVGFDVPAGAIVAILGPSGSGKTTLLNMAAGLAAPDHGRVEVMGRDTRAAVDWSRVGYMFQDDRLLPWRVAAGNVALALEAGSMPAPERRARARAELALVGLADFADAYPHQLSGGMQQRAALARTLMSDPDILLLDEPFGALDEFTRETLNEELLSIWHSGRTRLKAIIMVTHSIPEAVAMSDRIIVLGPRPARLLDVVVVRLPHPRDPADPDFARVLGLVRAAARPAP
jgi:ABC-type nitrate/sulfonate/bicarbonate transport system ATPase subunit